MERVYFITVTVAIMRGIGKTIKCMEKAVFTTLMVALPTMVVGIWIIFTGKAKSIMTIPNAFPTHLITKK